MSGILVTDIICQLQELQEGSRWFDQCIKEKVGSLSVEEAFAQPHPQVHSVAAHISHMLEWRKEALLRFEGRRTDLMNSPDDWKDITILMQTGWTGLLQEFYQSTELLTRVLADKDDRFLATPFQDTDYTFHSIIEGIIQHDLYHLGQIGVTLKLLRSN